MPATGALLDIRVVSLGIRAIVPGGRGRLDRDLRWGDDGWVTIRHPVRVPPVRVPVRPDGSPKTRPEEAVAAMPKAMVAVPAAVPPMPAAVAPPPRVPWPRTRHEQQDQQPEQHPPRRSRACGLLRVAHRVPLLPSPVGSSWKTPRPPLLSPLTRWQQHKARRPPRCAAACPCARSASAFGSVRVGSGVSVCRWGAAVRPVG